MTQGRGERIDQGKRESNEMRGTRETSGVKRKMEKRGKRGWKEGKAIITELKKSEQNKSWH